MKKYEIGGRKKALTLIRRIRSRLWSIILSNLGDNFTKEFGDLKDERIRKSFYNALREVSKYFYECAEVLLIDGREDEIPLTCISVERFMKDCEFDHVFGEIYLVDCPMKYDLNGSKKVTIYNISGRVISKDNKEYLTD